MRRIERSTTFKRDYKRESRGRYRTILDSDLMSIISTLAADMPLEPRYRDQDLSGNRRGYRDCHIKPDLVLIYRKPDASILQLVRLGSHSELFG